MSLTRILLGTLSLAAICIAQTITPAPTPSCNYCYLAPGFTDVSSANREYILFTAYSMTSAFTQNGFCFTVSGASSALPTPYFVAKPASTPTPSSSALASWFVNYLDVPDWGICGQDGFLAVQMADADTTEIVNVAVPTVLGAVSRTALLSASSTADGLVGTPSSDSRGASGGLSAGTRAAIAMVVVIAVLVVVVPGLALWNRYRSRRQREKVVERMVEEKLGMEETEMGSEGAVR